jgi:hypothetical protein
MREVNEELVDKMVNGKTDELNKHPSTKSSHFTYTGWYQNRASIFSSLPRDSFL